jgi:hypothetical protein
MHEMTMFQDETYGKFPGLPSEVTKKLQATDAWSYFASLVDKDQSLVSNFDIDEPRVDSCTIPTSQGPSSRSTPQESAGNLKATVTHHTAKDKELAADSHLRTELESKGEKNTIEERPAKRICCSREEVKSPEVSREACPSQDKCSAEVKSASEEKPAKSNKQFVHCYLKNNLSRLRAKTQEYLDQRSHWT